MFQIKLLIALWLLLCAGCLVHEIGLLVFRFGRGDTWREVLLANFNLSGWADYLRTVVGWGSAAVIAMALFGILLLVFWPTKKQRTTRQETG